MEDVLSCPDHEDCPLLIKNKCGFKKHYVRNTKTLCCVFQTKCKNSNCSYFHVEPINTENKQEDLDQCPDHEDCVSFRNFACKKVHLKKGSKKVCCKYLHKCNKQNCTFYHIVQPSYGLTKPIPNGKEDYMNA